MLVLNKQQEFYVSKQLINCMHSFFAEKKAKELLPGTGYNLLNSLMNDI